MCRLTMGGALALLIVLVTSPAAIASERTGSSDDPASVGAWQGVSWTDLDGQRWSAEELHGKVVLLDFWATWCLPCLAQVPHLRALSERFDEQDVVVLGVALDSMQRRPLRSFLGRHRIGWPQVHRPLALRSDAALHFGVDKVPATVVVDRRGRIVARDLTGPSLDATLQMLVDLSPRSHTSIDESARKRAWKKYLNSGMLRSTDLLSTVHDGTAPTEDADNRPTPASPSDSP